MKIFLLILSAMLFTSCHYGAKERYRSDLKTQIDIAHERGWPDSSIVILSRDSAIVLDTTISGLRYRKVLDTTRPDSMIFFGSGVPCQRHETKEATSRYVKLFQEKLDTLNHHK
jgi:hypothetical protein